MAVKFDLRFKIVSIWYKGRKIEEFCVSPLTYDHEVYFILLFASQMTTDFPTYQIVLKDVRLLFCLKNQVFSLYLAILEL